MIRRNVETDLVRIEELLMQQAGVIQAHAWRRGDLLISSAVVFSDIGPDGFAIRELCRKTLGAECEPGLVVLTSAQTDEAAA